MNQDLLKGLFFYDEATGVFTARTRRGNCVHVGDKAGSINNKGYRVIKVLGKAYKAHRLAFIYVYGYAPPEVDHINGDKDDNRISNLRDGSGGVNARNRGKPKNTTSALMGAHRGGWRGRRWVSSICTNGESEYLGIFQTEQQAHEVYMAAKKARHELGAL